MWNDFINNPRRFFYLSKKSFLKPTDYQLEKYNIEVSWIPLKFLDLTPSEFFTVVILELELLTFVLGIYELFGKQNKLP